MKTGQQVILIISVIFSISIFSTAYATPSVQILMEQSTFRYCEKLFYTIQVSEITGDPAIIHIRDENGTGSSAISIPISNLQNQVPSLVPFEAEVFPLGKYFVDVEYSGAKNSTEFNLIESQNVCIPAWIKQLTYYWVTGQISDNSFRDGIQFLIEKEIIVIPKTPANMNKVEAQIPTWVKTNAAWWIDEKISDNDFSQALQYLIKVGIIIV
jgi:hypothetical protein